MRCERSPYPRCLFTEEKSGDYLPAKERKNEYISCEIFFLQINFNGTQSYIIQQLFYSYIRNKTNLKL